MCNKCHTNSLIGDLVFTKSWTPVSLAIRTLTGAPMSHIGMYFKDRHLVESDWNGVELNSLSKYEGWASDYKIVALPKHLNRKVFVSEVLNKLGEGYDYPLLLGNLLTKLTLGQIPFTYYFDRPGRWMCSEVIAMAMVEAGAHFDRPIREIDPGYLLKYAEFYNGNL